MEKQRGWESLHFHIRVLRPLLLLVGVCPETLCFALSQLPIKSDRRQVSSFIHALCVLDAACNMKYLCGNIVMLRRYWHWHRGIRASLFVPQDERLFPPLAPRFLPTVSWLKEQLCVHVGIMTSVSTDNDVWSERSQRKNVTHLFVVCGRTDQQSVRLHCKCHRPGHWIWAVPVTEQWTFDKCFQWKRSLLIQFSSQICRNFRCLNVPELGIRVWHGS